VWHLASSGQFCRWRDVTVDWSIRLSLEVTHGQPESEVCQTMVRELTGVFALTQVQNITHFRSWPRGSNYLKDLRRKLVIK
jgi:hypothetical protein